MHQTNTMILYCTLLIIIKIQTKFQSDRLSSFQETARQTGLCICVLGYVNVLESFIICLKTKLLPIIFVLRLMVDYSVVIMSWLASWGIDIRLTKICTFLCLSSYCIIVLSCCYKMVLLKVAIFSLPKHLFADSYNSCSNYL